MSRALRVWVSFLAAGFALFSPTAVALTLNPRALEQELATAPIVVDVLVTAVADASEYPSPYYRAEAQVLQIFRADRTLPDRITIVGPGGNRVSPANGPGGPADQGVAYAGFALPEAGRRYRASLQPGAGSDFTVAGYRWGLVPRSGSGGTRSFTRNRVDGTDGSGEGAFLRWPETSFPVPFVMAYEDFRGRADIAEAIERSFRNWRDVPGVRFDVIAMGCVRGVQDGNDGINSVHFVTADWPFGASAIAVTRNYYYASGARAGIILDTDILLNAENYTFATDGSATSQDVENVITHEVGHFFGLGHEGPGPSFDIEATMFAFASPGETLKRTLAPHDIAGIRDAYPGQGPRPAWVPLSALCELERGPSCGAVPYSKGRGPAAPWLLLGLVLWLATLFAAGRVFVPRRR